MNTLEAIAHRKSVRTYTNDIVESDKLEKILNVGNWIQIVPWKVNEHLLENNEKINKILNSEKVFIYAKKIQTA